MPNFRIAILRAVGKTEYVLAARDREWLLQRLNAYRQEMLTALHLDRMAKWEGKTKIIRGGAPRAEFTLSEIESAESSAFAKIIAELNAEQLYFRKPVGELVSGG